MLHWRSISPLCWLIKVGRHLEFDHWAAICKAIMRWHSGIYIENCELKLSSILGNVLGKLNFRATLASILPFVQCFCRRASILWKVFPKSGTVRTCMITPTMDCMHWRRTVSQHSFVLPLEPYPEIHTNVTNYLPISPMVCWVSTLKRKVDVKSWIS